MRVSEGFRDFVLDQLAPAGDVRPRAMFGGIGLYLGDLFFGILASDVLYLKVDDETRPRFEREGAHPFRPYPDRAGTMQYYEVPVHILEDVDILAEWVRAAIEVASRAAAASPKRSLERARSRP